MSNLREAFEWRDEVLLPTLDGVIDLLVWAVDLRDLAILHHECDLMANLPSRLRQRLDWQLSQALRLEAKRQLAEVVDANIARRVLGRGYWSFRGVVSNRWELVGQDYDAGSPIDREFLRQLSLEVQK